MTMRAFLILMAAFVLTIWAANQPAQGQWVVKSGEIDYTSHIPAGSSWEFYDGMPDFDQKQDAWHDGSGNWNWCGPVAASNCLWWFDSKFERLRVYSLGAGTPVRPPTISDHYNLVYSFNSAWDDHDPSNLMPFINNLVTFLPAGGVPSWGVTASEIKAMIENYLASLPVSLWGHYTAKVVWYPDFDYIYEQVAASQDVLLLLGFWQTDGINWWRFGGHWVTVAGVYKDGIPTTPDSISFSDPYKDLAELGFPGVVWNGFLIAHPGPPHPSSIHNDAGNVSHDHYGIVDSSGSPGGIISCNYGNEYSYDDWMNFFWKNFPPRLEEYAGYYYDNWPVHVEIEDLVVICPNFDYGDLQGDYPTQDIESCGPAHPLTDKAWLGDSINAELRPDTLDLDIYDDGVSFNNLPWMPCTNVSVTVTVTTGAHYLGESLYLSAWKDGNIDGDFDDGPGANEDDWLCCSEWVIQDASVTAGSHTFTFCDPGVFDLGRYDLRMRFRLTSQPVGRFGYGGYWGGGSSNGWGTYDIDWVLGEVEDYIWRDMQLAVELKSFDAVPGDGEVTLRWATATEQDNARFILDRRSNGEWAEIARVSSRGNSTIEQAYQFVDGNVRNGTRYEYRLTSQDLAGVLDELGTVAATPTAAVVPASYALYQNYPNPFNATTVICFDLRERTLVDLSIFDISGRLVATLVHEELPASQHTITFDAADLPAGVYFYRLEAGGFASTKKMMLLK
jgi:hypothetical protein